MAGVKGGGIEGATAGIAFDGTGAGAATGATGGAGVGAGGGAGAATGVGAGTGAGAGAGTGAGAGAGAGTGASGTFIKPGGASLRLMAVVRTSDQSSGSIILGGGKFIPPPAPRGAAGGTGALARASGVPIKPALPYGSCAAGTLVTVGVGSTGTFPTPPSVRTLRDPEGGAAAVEPVPCIVVVGPLSIAARSCASLALNASVRAASSSSSSSSRLNEVRSSGSSGGSVVGAALGPLGGTTAGV